MFLLYRYYRVGLHLRYTQRGYRYTPIPHVTPKRPSCWKSIAMSATIAFISKNNHHNIKVITVLFKMMDNTTTNNDITVIRSTN